MRVSYQRYSIEELLFFFTFQDLFDATSRCKDTFGIFKCVGCSQAIYREKTYKFEISDSSVREAFQMC